MEITTHIISLPFFHGLLNEHIQDLLDVAKIRIYKKKSSVYLYGDLADRFFIIMDGWVKLCQATMDGNEVILALFTRGDSFGEAIVVDGAVYPNNAEIVEDAKLIELPAQALKEVAKSALKRKSGARGLRAVLENAMLDIMYEVPFLDNISKCKITKEVISGNKEPELYFRESQKTA